MKKLAILLTSFLLVFNCFSQRSTRTYEQYMEKSRKHTVGAFVFLGTGAALTAGGTALIISGSNRHDDYDYGDSWEGRVIGGAIMMVGGIALMGTSIPFFIMSHRYRMKAMNLAFKTEKMQMPRMGKQGTQYYPALALRLNIGR